MPKVCTIHISPEQLDQPQLHKKRIARQMGIDAGRIQHIQLKRRSIDARKGKPKYVLQYQTWIDEPFESISSGSFPLQQVSGQPEVWIAGTGPAGLFAALELISMGIKPILIDRGKAVRPRRRDLALITREGQVNPDSNYCFGEGGAGTFSDGKLYTRSTKRGDTQKVLTTLVQFGATEEILIDAHPHIGTNKLPGIIENMREAILASGGEVHFETRLTDWKITHKGLKSIQLNEREWVQVPALILATGHSARDIFRLIHRHKLELEPKPFALGVRVEHPQVLIDQIQYSCNGNRHPNLPAAAYSLVKQVDEKGVYSFCMCPGGIICPAATADDEVVVNGWSPSMRNTGFANSGIVVEIKPEDYMAANPSPLDGIQFQAGIEKLAYAAGGGKQVAPAQRLVDFTQGRFSNQLPECSYLPGTRSVEMSNVLPPFVYKRLQKGFRLFGKSLRNYLTNEALVLGVESRTSSPVRILRDDKLMHPQAAGLFPCGEGAGYAGGIMSAAIDGQKCARAAYSFIAEKA